MTDGLAGMPNATRSIEQYALDSQIERRPGLCATILDMAAHASRGGLAGPAGQRIVDAAFLRPLHLVAINKTFMFFVGTGLAMTTLGETAECCGL